MKIKNIFFSIFVLSNVCIATAQINLGERALGAIGKGLKAFTFSDADAANLSLQAVAKMDIDNKIAGSKDAYSTRLNRVFGKHVTENGLKLNFKVYINKDVNAFATADGSVRVFSGLMDIMDDNELLAVIGHEIGHVANKDSRDAMKAAYTKSALIDAAASQSEKIATLSDGQIGQLANAYLDSKHSRKQETEADNFSYDFMKKHGYNVNAVESAFNILSKLSNGAEAGFLERMMASHPDAADRAANAKKRAEDDGLYKPYIKVVKAPGKKTKKKK
jgi:putative metalloprotease